MKKVKSLEEFGLTCYLLGALSARLLGNLSAGKEVIRGEGTIRDGQDFKCRLHL